MFQKLKQDVFDANMLLPKYGLITFTWGNVSAFDDETGLVVIKPSGIPYEIMKVEDMVVLDLSGKIIEGNRKPSSDTATHLELYRNFKNIRGIVHTHSHWATVFAQAGLPIPAFGTTHADYFAGEVPVTRFMTSSEIRGDYEFETGKVIVERFKDLNPDHIPGVLVNAHGPFTWGKNANEAVHNAVVLESIAQMAFNTRILMGNKVIEMQSELLNKHFYRKHGKGAYYGQ
jgi:L-ribulose-5-phosphate 4-epimerase